MEEGNGMIIFERPQRMWWIRIIDKGGGSSTESAEIERNFDTNVLEEHAVMTFRVTVTISAALVQDLSPLFFPLSWWATFLAAFPCNWPISSSQSLQCLAEPNSVTLKREAALPLKHLYQHSLWSYTVSQPRWLSFVQNVPYNPPNLCEIMF